MEKCVLCEQSLSDGKQTSTLTAKGCAGIQKASAARKSSISVVPGQQIHTECRKVYVNPNSIACDIKKRTAEEIDEDATPYVLRSSDTSFSYKNNCLFCGVPDIYNEQKPEYTLIHVKTQSFQDTILQVCDREKGEWVDTVRARILHANDLFAAEAVYHQLCNVNFRTGKGIPHIFMSKDSEKSPKYRKVAGRPKDAIRVEAFSRVVQYLEQNDDEQITVSDLIEKMGEYTESEDCDPYSFKYMKRQLKEHFGDKIIITEINGKANVVTFHTTADKILHDFRNQTMHSSVDETTQIIQTAAKLIKNDIKSVKQSKDTYPDCIDISSTDAAIDYLPKSLYNFLEILFIEKDHKAKLASIGQAIMQAARPRVLLAPLQIGLAVQLHHHFQSKFLIDSLHEQGFCSSYPEVNTFERSAAVSQGTDIQNHTADHVLQYAADNVDHNVRSIDGKGTFHGMGIIATITPAMKMSKVVERVHVTAEDIAFAGRINIHNFVSEKDCLESMYYEQLTDPDVEDPHTHLDLIWKLSLLLKVPCPLWSGFMHMVHREDHPGKSSVIFLPMIDMDPNDMTCIYSTLKFVCSHAMKYNCTPVITFDQPLWWNLKAHRIVAEQPRHSDLHSMVVRLGGFHTEMSYLGSR